MRRPLQPSRTTAPAADSQVLKFVFRPEQLQLRGQRNYGRWKMLTKGFVGADSRERVQWQNESAEESQRDVAWSRRHGPIPGGASILPWRDEHDDSARQSASGGKLHQFIKLFLTATEALDGSGQPLHGGRKERRSIRQTTRVSC